MACANTYTIKYCENDVRKKCCCQSPLYGQMGPVIGRGQGAGTRFDRPLHYNIKIVRTVNVPLF